MKKLMIVCQELLPGVSGTFLFISLNLLIVTSLFAQDNPVKELTYYATEEVKTQTPPSFPGGHPKLVSFIRNEIKNSPDKVKLDRKVYITAKINEQGKVIELKPAYSANSPLEKELRRIASIMPVWEAGTVNGKGVLTGYTFLLRRKD